MAIPTLEFSDEERRAIRSMLGQSGKATRAECVAFVEECLAAALSDVEDEEDEEEEIEGIPHEDFEELEDELRIADRWI